VTDAQASRRTGGAAIIARSWRFAILLDIDLFT